MQIDKIKAMAQLGLNLSSVYTAMTEPAADIPKTLALALGYDYSDSGVRQCVNDLCLASFGEKHTVHQSKYIIQSIAREGVMRWLDLHPVERHRDYLSAYGRKFVISPLYMEIADTHDDFRTVSPLTLLAFLNAITGTKRVVLCTTR